MHIGQLDIFFFFLLYSNTSIIPYTSSILYSLLFYTTVELYSIVL